MRGTEVAMYDYALYNEEILGNTSYIISDNKNEKSTLDKFKARFEVMFYNSFNEAQKLIDKRSIDAAYFIKSGANDGKLFTNTKNNIHAVFQEKDIHGDNYAYVSEWLASKMGMPDQYVPHIVMLPQPTKTFREKLNIPQDAIVIGRYGGYNEFNIPFVIQAIKRVLDSRKDVYFLMMNTSPFYIHERLVYVGGTYDLQNKSNFINTCDYMIHARDHGESFGLSICEFLFFNKPVVTYKGGLDQNHITVLQDRGIYYTDYNSILDILLHISSPKDNVNDLVTQFLPTPVMSKFKHIFLN
jgi:hypothetical protein